MTDNSKSGGLSASHASDAHVPIQVEAEVRALLFPQISNTCICDVVFPRFNLMDVGFALPWQWLGTCR